MIHFLNINETILVTKNICSISPITLEKKSTKYIFYINLMDGNGHKISFDSEPVAQKARTKLVEEIEAYNSYLLGGKHAQTAREFEV